MGLDLFLIGNTGYRFFDLVFIRMFYGVCYVFSIIFYFSFMEIMIFRLGMSEGCWEGKVFFFVLMK